MTVQYFEIGLTYETLVNVETLTDQAPNMAPAANYRPYQSTIATGANTRKALGSPVITWTWGYIYADMFEAFRTLCPGASVDVIIRSRIESGDEITEADYDYYQATLVWPDPESYEFNFGTYQPFQLTFQNLIPYELPD